MTCYNLRKDLITFMLYPKRTNKIIIKVHCNQLYIPDQPNKHLM